MNKKWIWIISGVVVVVVALLGLKKAGIIGKEDATKVAIIKNVIDYNKWEFVEPYKKTKIIY